MNIFFKDTTFSLSYSDNILCRKKFLALCFRTAKTEKKKTPSNGFHDNIMVVHILAVETRSIALVKATT